MYCSNCEMMLPYTETFNPQECTSCGSPWIVDLEDIFVRGMYGILKENRPTQYSLAIDIENSITHNNPGTHIGEGGTGIGKSFAYLIPAIRAGKRIIITTATKSLQHQLIKKDLPFLLEKLGINISYLLYKGADNYACWKLVKNVPPKERKRFKEFVGKAYAENKPADVVAWGPERPKWWSAVSTANCMGSNCTHYDGCRVHPEKYTLVVANHHLLALDLRYGKSKLLGDYDTVILDEAHNAPEAFRSIFTNELSNTGFISTINHTLNDPGMYDVMVSYVGISLVEQLRQTISLHTQLHKKANTLKQRNTGIVNLPGKALYHELNGLGDMAMIASNAVGRVVKHLYVSAVTDQHPQDESFRLLAKLRKLEKVLYGVYRFCSNVLDNPILYDGIAPIDVTPPLTKKQTTSNYIFIMAEDNLKYVPVDIGKTITRYMAQIDKKILVSATLQLGGSFDHITENLGLTNTPNLTGKTYASPFNLRKKVLVYLPRNIPLPEHVGGDQDKREAWIAAINNEIMRLTEIVNGDALVLYTSRADMLDVLNYQRQNFPQYKIHNVVHGSNPKETLTEYMNTAHSVLHGLKTFWEGIDIPGDKLRMVIFPKLYFPHFHDPIIHTLSNQYTHSGFNRVSVPRMLLTMVQGAGRLIRTRTDYGVIAFLDVRVWSGTKKLPDHNAILNRLAKAEPKDRKCDGYGKLLIKTLGFTHLHDDFTYVERFVKKCLHNHKQP